MRHAHFSRVIVSIGIFIGAMLPASFAKASLLLYDPFNYTPGGTALIGQTDTSTPSVPNQTWAATGTNNVGVGPTVESGNLSLNGVTYPNYPASVGALANLKKGTTGDFWEPRIGIGATIGSASGTVYYSLLVNLPATNITNGSSGVFIAGFNNTTGSQGGSATVLGGELCISSASGGFHFGVGVTTAAGATRVFGSDIFSANTTNLIVVSYTFGAGTADDVAKLYVNPSDSLFTNGITTSPIPDSVTPEATVTGDMTSSAFDFIKSVFLRDNSNEPTGGVNVDELRVWTVPEPTSIALLATGSAMLLGRRRQCRRT